MCTVGDTAEDAWHIGAPGRFVPGERGRADWRTVSNEEVPRSGLSRRSLITAGVWAAPVVVLATAVPAAAASVTGEWTLTDVSARFTDMNSVPELGPWALSMSGDLGRVDGQPITEPGSALIRTDTGETHTWFYSAGPVPYPFSTAIFRIVDPIATSFTFTIGEDTLGPFPISPLL